MPLLRFIIFGSLISLSLPILATSTSPEKISLQLKWLNSFQFAGYYAAKAKGFYAEENLDVELRERKVGINSTHQVINGESEYGVADTALLVERLNGIPVVVLASIFQHNPLVYVTLKSSGIVSPYEMRDKRIMDDNNDNAALRAMLYESNLTEKEFIHLPNSGDINDLIEGKTDVVSAYSTDEVDRYKQRGIEINIIDPRNYGLDFLGDNLFTTQQEINTHPERVEKFIRASLKGWEYAVNHPDEIVNLIFEQYNTQSLTLEHLRFEARETVKVIAPRGVPIGHSDSKRFERIAATYKELGLVKLTENLKGFVYGQQTNQPLHLTDAEREWLKAHPIIRVGIDPHFAPYEWLDEKNDYVGLSADYLHQVENQLGIKFEIVKSTSFAETIFMSENGELDMIADVNKTPNREQYLNFTEPYISNPIIIVDNNTNSFIGGLTQLSGKRLAIEKGYFTGELIAHDYPKIEIISTENEREALQLVSKGEADAYVGDAASVNYEIRKSGMLNLHFAGETEYRSNHRMGALKSHPELISLLAKALNAIPETEKTQIQNRWLSLKIETELNWKRLLKYAMPLVIALLLVIYWNFRLRQEIVQRLKLEAALQHSIHLFQSVLDNAPMIRIFWKDLNGCYLGGNAAFMKDAGLDCADELIGKNDYELPWKEFAKSYRADDRHITQSNKSKLHYEKLLILPNGKKILSRTSKVPLHDEKKNVIGLLGIYEDITDARTHAEQLEYIAHHDMLTGLPNRLLLADRMKLALANTKREQCLMAVGYIDLDGFKTVNDKIGRKAGDYLLVEAAKRIKNALREEDTVARLGGDEFAFLLLKLNSVEECEMTLHRLLKTISVPFRVEQHLVSISASIGVTIYPNDNANSDTLLRHADQAMYDSKQNHKNCFKIYNMEVAHEFQAHQSALHRIERALIKDEFVLYFQPKVDMRKGEIIGAESLIRWQHPERGLVMPNEFLGLIEHHPLAIQIDTWVMNKALAQMAKWHENGLMWTVSVNISARTLQTNNFVEQLKKLLDKYPSVKPKHFELEILETEALHDLAQTSKVMVACQAFGVKFSLDDFGTGYSSLSYLKHLPADILKIDQSFVRNMLFDLDDLAIVEGVIGLASSFKRYVIAEGVESIEHGTALSKLNCHYAQGYAIAKPMPADIFEMWASNWESPEEWKELS
ncbi:MAG: EAL domain-containing protein [Methylococcales bacterium]|nr:EAL domain-containing protein [Methylococcales bacterium]MDD5753235.1 EAL domain-containing protein [Methylococcales bacterium]